MKKLMAVDPTATVGSATAVIEFASVENSKLWEARRHARELRDMFSKLTALEKTLAAKQVEAVRKLVEAVEAL